MATNVGGTVKVTHSHRLCHLKVRGYIITTIYKLSKEFKVIILGDYGNVRGIYIQETRMQMNNRKLSKGVK